MNDEYLKKLYSYLGAQDSEYHKRTTYDDFKSKMGSEDYSTKVHGYIKGIDSEFRSLEDFNSMLKKKSSNWGSTLGSGSSASQKTERKATKEIAKTKDLRNVADKGSEIFTGYPGKEKNQYEFSNGNWYELNPEVEKTIKKSKESYVPVGGLGESYGGGMFVNPSGAGQDFATPGTSKNSLDAIKNVPKKRIIEDDDRIKALNKQFGKNASLDEYYETFDNYDNSPEKKKNKYRIKNGSWERLVDEATEWSPISNEGSINALNRRYGKNIDAKKAIVVKPKEIDPFLKVNSNFLAQSEESAQQMLEKNFKGMGFTFEQTGAGGDYIKVTPNNGNEPQTFSFNNVGNSTRGAFSSPTGMSIGNNNSKELEKNIDQAVKLQSYLRFNASAEKEDDLSAVNRIKNNISIREKKYDLSPLEKNNEYYNTEDYKNNFKELTFQQKKQEIKRRVDENANLSASYGKGVLGDIYTSVFGEDEKYYKTEKDLKKFKDKLNSSEEYKLFVSEQKKYDAQKREKYDKLYDEWVIVKQSGNKEDIKTVKAKIEGGYSKELIGDNLTHMTGSQYDLKHSINDFNKRKEKLQLDAKNGNLTQEQYNDAVEGLSSEAQRLDVAAKNVAATQKKMNVLAGIYVTEKAKSGGFFGNFTNSLLVSVDELISSDGLSGKKQRQQDEIEIKSQDITPQQRQYYKDKGYNDEQIKNVFINNAQKNAIAANKRAIIETFGSDLTTEESKQNLGFVEQALVGVAASLPSMALSLIPVVGQAAAFGGMANMSYNAINEEMLNDTDFETTSEGDRAIVAIPYAVVMGALEKVGMNKMLKGESTIGKIVLSRIAKIIPKGATREVIENIANKEVKSLVAKGALKVIGGTLAEAETGALQAGLLDVGLKSLFNVLDPLDLKLTNKEGLTGGEAFATPDTKMGVAGAILEGSVAEAIGGFAMSTVMVGSQGLINGKISLYNKEDLKFFEDFSSDQEFKKLIVSNLKTQMLNGTMTKGEAQSALNDIDLVEGVFNSIDENISDEAKIIAFNLINERNRLEKEVIGKDPALSKEKNDRIKDINDKLGTLPLQVLVVNNVERATKLENALKQKGAVIIDGETINRKAAQTELDKINQKVSDAERKQEEDAIKASIPEEISSLKDDEPFTKTVKTLEEIPEEFRDRAQLSPLTEVETRKKIFGLPIGKKGSKLIGGGYTYTLTGKEAKDYAIQEQTAGQVPIQPTTAVGEEVVQGEPKTEPQALTEEGKAEEVAPLTIQEELQLIEEEKAKTPTLEAPVIEAPVVEATPQEKVATYRAEEQAELLKAIPKIESYKVKGKVDKTKMPRTVLAKYNKIYEKYDALISPLLEPVVKAPVVKAKAPKAPVVKAPIVKAEAPKAKGELPVLSWSNVDRYKDDVIRAMREIQNKLLTPLLALKYNTTTEQKKQIIDIRAKIALADKILKRNFARAKREQAKIEKEKNIKPTAKVETTKTKVETDKLNSEEKQYALESGIPEEDAIPTRSIFKKVISRTGITVERVKQLIKSNKYTEKKVKVDEISPSQLVVERDLISKIENEDNLPIIGQLGNEFIVLDGHHRISTYIRNGAKTINAKVIDLSTIQTKAEPVKEEVKVEAPVAEEVVEQYQPITIEKIFNDRFSKENAISYDEEERETDNGRMSTYISSITMDVTNEDGDSIGTLTKLVDEDRIITWNGEDFDGNQLSEQDFDFKDDARQAIVDKWNKEQKKNFDREAKKKIKDAQKAKEKADKAAAKEEAKSASVVKKEEAPAPAKESTDDLMGAINSIKEDIKVTTEEIEKARAEAKEKIEKINAENIDLDDLEADIKEIQGDLKKDLDGLKLDLDRHVQALKEEVKKLGDLDAKAPENKKTLLSYLDAAIKTLNGLNSNNLLNVKVDVGFTITKWVTVGVLKKILQGIRAGVIAGNTINASIRAMAKEYRSEHKNIKITIDEFTKEIEEYLRNTFVDQKKKTNEQDIQEARDKFVEIREAVRKAKVAVKTESKALRANAFDAIQEMLKGKVKKLSAVQMKSIMLRLASFNVFSQTQYDKFIDYVDKVIGIADYDAKVTKANKDRKFAKKNMIKLGDISSDLLDPLSRVLSINAKLIPSDVFESYAEIVEMLSKRDAVLKLNKRADLNESLDKIIESIESNEQRISDLKDLYDSFAGKTADYAETLDEMLKVGIINQSEHKLMKTFKSKIQGPKVKDKMTEQQIADEKAELINEINNTTITLDEIVGNEFRLERDLVKRLQDLLKNKKTLENLNNKDLKDLLRVIDNINNGFVSNATQEMVEKLNFIEKSILLESSIPETFKVITARINQSLEKRISKRINVAPLFNIDQQLGDFKTKNIFNSVFNESAKAQQGYQSAITLIQDELDKIERGIATSFENEPNKIILSQFKMMVYMMQLEYDSNPNNNQVHQAMKTLDETIKFAKQNSEKSGYNNLDIAQMESIKKEFEKDGEIDIDKLYNSFNEAEKNGLNKLQEINDRMTKFATYTATVINGNKIKSLKNYISYTVINESDILSASETTDQINNINANMQPGTVSKNLEERDGKVHPVYLNPFYATNSSSRSVLLNYHMTEPVRTARKTLRNTKTLLEEKKGTTKDQYDILNAITGAYNTATKDLLESNFTQSNKYLEFIKRQGYRTMLASGTRAAAELSSNVAFVLLNNPRDMRRGVSKEIKEIEGVDRMSIMTNLKSTVKSRVQPTSLINSPFVELITNANRSSKSKNTKTEIRNGVRQVWDETGQKYVDVVAGVADYLISKPDQVIMRRLWFGAFSRAFEKEAGIKPDFDKIIKNDEEYMDKYKDALEKATTMADKQVVSAGSSMNSYMGILQNVVRQDDKGGIIAIKEFNRFMNKFTVQEYYTAREGVRALVGNGTISRGEGIQVLAAVTLRMTIYSVFTRLFSEGLLAVLGYGGDDDDEKTAGQKISQGILSSITTLVFGRYFGNFIRVAENALIELANKEYGEAIGLRDGEYDPYEDAIQFNQLQEGKIDEPTDFFKIIAGPLAPLIGVGELTFKLGSSVVNPPKTERARLTKSKEWYRRLPLEIGGQLGVVPFYKDFRKIVLEGVYKELKEEVKEKAVKTKAKEIKTALTDSQKTISLKEMMNSGEYTREGIKKELRKIKDPEYRKALKDKDDAIRKKILDKYGYENLTDFKRNDEDNYEIEFGDDSPYRIERAESAKIANELEKRLNALEDGEEYYSTEGTAIVAPKKRANKYNRFESRTKVNRYNRFESVKKVNKYNRFE